MFPFHTKSYILIIEYWLRGNASEFLLRKTRNAKQGGIMDFVGTVWALLPPVIAIVLALITKEVYMSLFIGVVTGALLYTNFSPVGTIEIGRAHV